jgi:hypothetical protein
MCLVDGLEVNPKPGVRACGGVQNAQRTASGPATSAEQTAEETAPVTAAEETAPACSDAGGGEADSPATRSDTDWWCLSRRSRGGGTQRSTGQQTCNDEPTQKHQISPFQ